MSLLQRMFQRRQNVGDDDNGDDEIIIDDNDGFWYSSTAYIIKWSLIAAAMLLCLLIILAYLHAQRRMRKGLSPMAYHKWLVRRKDRMQFDPAYQNQYMANSMNNWQQNAYPMNGYAPNQPVYGNALPGNMPPDGFSKVSPDQSGAVGGSPPATPPVRGEDTPASLAPVAGIPERERL